MLMSRSGLSASARFSASASTRRPSASVLPISTVSPFRLCSTSPGRKASPEIEFSTAGISTRRRTGNLASRIMAARPSTLAAPPMSFFISNMPEDGLMSSPPVSKHTPLPTSVILGARAEPKLMSTRRGARVDARPTAWIIGNSRASFAPDVTADLPLCILQSSSAAWTSSSGPMSDEGVFTRSRVSFTART